jgi:hypothetical protein
MEMERRQYKRHERQSVTIVRRNGKDSKVSILVCLATYSAPNRNRLPSRFALDACLEAGGALIKALSRGAVSLLVSEPL